MKEHHAVRLTLLITEAFVAFTALIGGLALIIGSAEPTFEMGVIPPNEYLEGSWFDSYIVPGLLLAGVVGGIHALAFMLLLRDLPMALLTAAAAAYAILIWIFVQMILIPFSLLQAVYFAIGAFELGLVLLLLGLVKQPRGTRPRSVRNPG